MRQLEQMLAEEEARAAQPSTTPKQRDVRAQLSSSATTHTSPVTSSKGSVAVAKRSPSSSSSSNTGRNSVESTPVEWPSSSSSSSAVMPGLHKSASAAPGIGVPLRAEVVRAEVFVASATDKGSPKAKVASPKGKNSGYSPRVQTKAGLFCLFFDLVFVCLF